MREDPERYNCETCAHRLKYDALFGENAEALEIYRSLTSRFLGALEAQTWLLDRWTTGWPIDDTLALVQRLDVIHDVLSPDPNG